MVPPGVPCREAYKQVGLSIEAGQFGPRKEVHHSHEGSSGNLCTEQIALRMQRVVDGFGFERANQAEKNLLNMAQ